MKPCGSNLFGFAIEQLTGKCYNNLKPMLSHGGWLCHPGEASRFAA